MATLPEILDFFENLFPSSLAILDDRTGLAIKGERYQIVRILVALELNREIFNNILRNNIDFLYLHHPPLWTPLAQLSCDDPWSQMVTRLFHDGISVLAHHTNLDVCSGGIADQWVKLLQLTGSVRPLQPRRSTFFKIITYVPPDSLESVTQALFQAGAGKLGPYGSCSFQGDGIGTFLPLEGAQPFLGKIGHFEKTREIRVEVTLPDPGLLGFLVEAIKKNHPYQKPVIDIYPLFEEFSDSEGLGRIILLDQPLHTNELIDRLQQFPEIDSRSFLFFHQSSRILSKIALCPGSGGSLLETVRNEKVDAYISGDLSHHEIETLKLHQVDYFPIPHGAGERLALKMIFPLIKKYGHGRFPEIVFSFEDELPQ